MTDQELAAGLSFDYEYDDIGNREYARSGGDSTGQNQRQTTYTADNLNQYSNIAHPRSLDVLVRAPEADAVTVSSPGNTVNTSKQGAWNRAEVTSPSNDAQWLEVDASAGGQNIAVDQHLWLPPASTAPQYDPDGNLESDGRWTYTWDAENRLISMQRSTNVGPNLRLEFRYDPNGRRLARKIIDLANSAAILSDLRFAYDGWNLIAEFQATGQTLTPIRTHTWGIDLSNTPQGAGGVGGLLSSTQISQSPIPNVPYYPSYDGNGNIIAWSDASGAVRRRIDYDPFGNVTTSETASPTMPDLPFGFSTKYNDSDTGLLYYGYRYYDPATGRWPSRDPIEERGGLNLYGFVGNCGIISVDPIGLSPKSQIINIRGVIDYSAKGIINATSHSSRWGTGASITKLWAQEMRVFNFKFYATCDSEDKLTIYRESPTESLIKFYQTETIWVAEERSPTFGWSNGVTGGVTHKMYTSSSTFSKLMSSDSSFTYKGESAAVLLVSGVVEGPDNLNTASTTSASSIISSYMTELPWIGPLIGSFTSSGPTLHPVLPKGRFDAQKNIRCCNGSVRATSSIKYTKVGSNPPFRNIWVDEEGAREIK